MPIIPGDWTGQNSINISNSSGSSSASEIFSYSVSKAITVTDIDNYIDLIGYSTIDINREISLDILSGKVKLYWKNQDDSYTLINFSDLTFNNGFIDSSIDKLGFAIKCSEISEIFFTCRWDKESDFYIYTENLPEEPIFWSTIPIEYSDYIEVSQIPQKPVFIDIGTWFFTSPKTIYEYPIINGNPEYSFKRQISTTATPIFQWSGFEINKTYGFYIQTDGDNPSLRIYSVTQESTRWLISC